MSKQAIEKVLYELSDTVMEDNNTHQHRFAICSQSSDRMYTVAQQKTSGEWQCSCPDWIFRHKSKENYLCKHLKAIHPALKKIDQLQLAK